MKEQEVMPRVLADDIAVTAEGENAEEKFEEAFEDTLKYMEDIGAKVAIKKSHLFSTNRCVRMEPHTRFTQGFKRWEVC